MGTNSSPPKKPLTPRLAVPPLPKGEGEKPESHLSPLGKGWDFDRANGGELVVEDTYGPHSAALHVHESNKAFDGSQNTLYSCETS